jgi:micrococcal nuclease
VSRCARFLLAGLLAIVLLGGCGTQEQGGQSKEVAAAPATTADTTKAETAAQERTTARAKARSEATKAKSTQTASSPATSQGSSEKAGPTVNAEINVTVTRVVDGDTLEISPAIEGITDLRLIGVDTPETKEPNCTPQPYGAEASAFTTAQLSGQQVGLEFDVERTDRYDRLLAYVYKADEMFNETLLREGYAQLATFPPNVKYVERFQEAQAEARAVGKGLWGQSPEQLAQQTDRGNGVGGDGCTPPQTNQPPPRQPQQQLEPTPDDPPPSDFPDPPSPVTPASPPSGDSCSSGAIKGNVSNSGELIYHVPDGEFYDLTNPEQCFASTSEAEEAGYRASKR